MVADKMRANWNLIIFIIFVVDLSLAKVDSMAEESLRESLMVNYNKDVFPPRNTTGPVKIFAGFSLVSIRDIDERLRNMELAGRLQLCWDDPRLRWDPKKHNGTLSLRMGVNHLWKPEITQYTSADVPFDSPTEHALLHSNGHVVWTLWSQLTASCVHKSNYFPLDTLNCSLQFGSRLCDGFHLDFELYENISQVYVSNMEENNEWTVVSTSAKKTMREYECCGESFADVTFHLTLERPPSWRRAAIVLPLFSAFLLAYFPFLISPFDKQRLFIHAFDVIVLLLTLLYLQQLLPISTRSTPAIVFVCETMIAIVMLGMVWNIGLMSIYRHCCKQRPPRWVQRLAQCWMGKKLLIPQPDNKQEFGSDHLDQSHDDQNNVWMAFFRFLGYFVDLSFIAVLLALLYMFVLKKLD